MDIDLTGKAVAVTGASSGIGEATALAVAAAGGSVALGARRKDRIDSLANRINGEGGTAVAIEVDVSEEDRARAFVEGAAEQLGRLDALINNAGVMLLGPIEGADTGEWRTMIDANVYGLIYATHAALPIMRAQGGGHIVNVSSVAGRVARSGSGVYNLTKHGIGAFSESLRQEVTESGIRVTLIEPGAVETELAGHNRPEIRDQIEDRFAGIDKLAAEDIANAIVYTLGQPAHVSLNEVLIRPTGQVG